MAEVESQPAAGSGRRSLALALAVGAAGACAALLASRQEFGRVVVLAPRPLPASVTTVTGQDLRPAIGALAVAALASLGAVLATRGVLRKVTGLVTVALGAGLGIVAAGPVTAAQALGAVASGGAAPAAGAGAGTAPGSVTAGGAAAGGDSDPLTGLPVHVLLTGSWWRAVMVAGALALIAAGIVILVRAGRMPVMSGRYSRTGRAAAFAPAAQSRLSSAPAVGTAQRRAGTGSTGNSGSALWESLSAGEDPTAWPAG
jgi:hypothetical protein